MNNNLDWIRKESITCIGLNELNIKIQYYCSAYKTNLVASKIETNFAKAEDKYELEVWYNFASKCNVITIKEIL